ncbi:MAG: hypothetical protein IT583_03865 [Verrucomicrobia bacterium]|nr:hypothetical protein [Verrucomicrobiota bacterium]
MDIKLATLLCTTGIIALTTIVFGIIGMIAFYKAQAGQAKSFGLLFRRGNFLRLATVIMVIIAVIFLGLLDIIKENGIIGILSGIAGYVLGGMDQSRKPDADGNIE